MSPDIIVAYCGDIAFVLFYLGISVCSFEFQLNGGDMDRKFSQYIAVSSALRRAGVSNYGMCSTTLLEAFLEDSGRITASKVVSRKLCNEGEFSVWRKQLIDKGWLIWSEVQTDKGQYFPGKKLMPYINKEKISSKEIVTKDEVLPKAEAATKVELEAVKSQLDAIEQSMKKVYDKLELGKTDPPGYGKLHDRLISIKAN